MSVHKIIYSYQHRILPNNLFKFRQDFIALVLGKKDVIYHVLDDIFQEEGMENPYSENQFEVKLIDNTEEFLSVKIKFPLPKEELLCFESYIFVDKEFEKLMYFCIERGAEPDIAFICSWSEKGAHLNYGSCLYDEQECYKRCWEIYVKA